MLRPCYILLGILITTNIVHGSHRGPLQHSTSFDQKERSQQYYQPFSPFSPLYNTPQPPQPQVRQHSQSHHPHHGHFSQQIHDLTQRLGTAEAYIGHLKQHIDGLQHEHASFKFECMSSFKHHSDTLILLLQRDQKTSLSRNSSQSSQQQLQAQEPLSQSFPNLQACNLTPLSPSLAAASATAPLVLHTHIHQHPSPLAQSYVASSAEPIAVAVPSHEPKPSSQEERSQSSNEEEICYRPAASKSKSRGS